jgi:hypothetical protein
MAKKQVGVSLRKPPPPADADAFVTAGSAANAAALAELRNAALEITPTPVSAEIVVSGVNGPRTLREMTLYLPKDLAQKLALHCVERDCDVSHVIADAVSMHLDKVAGANVSVKPAGETTAKLPPAPAAATTTTTATASESTSKKRPRVTFAETWSTMVTKFRSRLVGAT